MVNASALALAPVQEVDVLGRSRSPKEEGKPARLTIAIVIAAEARNPGIGMAPLHEVGQILRRAHVGAIQTRQQRQYHLRPSRLTMNSMLILGVLLLL